MIEITGIYPQSIFSANGTVIVLGVDVEGLSKDIVVIYRHLFGQIEIVEMYQWDEFGLRKLGPDHTPFSRSGTVDQRKQEYREAVKAIHDYVVNTAAFV